MTLGRVNASARKRTSGSSRLICPMSHSQNPNGFVCGLSTRKILTPCPIQNRVMSRSSIHSPCQSSDSKSNG